jgi:CxxC motif-containing protein (DUF1111 family)
MKHFKILALTQVTCLLAAGACGKHRETDNPFRLLPGGKTTVNDRSSSAFTFPAANLTDEENALHASGDLAFESRFVAAPAETNPGLGPVFNNVSCESCHLKNGRGMPVLSRQGAQLSHLLVRVSLEDETSQDATQGPKPVPGLGGQLQDHSIAGSDPEVLIDLQWETLDGEYPDGSSFELRQPQLTITHPDGTPLDSNIKTSLRGAPPVFGLGLLEAIPESTLQSLADENDANGDGISGRLNYVWDPVDETVSVGRFGWKANTANLVAQAASAFAEDMGIGNPFLADSAGNRDISEDVVREAAFYTQTLGVPDRFPLSAEAQLGERLFTDIGCENCHTSHLKTGEHPTIPSLSHQDIQPFTDLLLHDMGDGLADGRADFLANGREWRTPPLWGIGLTQTVLPYSGYLHDGRARTLEEAILWHGGEAEPAKSSFMDLPKSDRQAVIAFLRAL